MTETRENEMQRRGASLRIFGPVICTVFVVYLAHQLFRFANFPALLTIIGVAWVAAVIYSIVAIILIYWLNPEKRESSADSWILKFGTFCQGYVSYLLTLVVLRDVVSFLAYLAGKEIFNYGQTEAIDFLILPLGLMTLGRLVVALGPFVRRVKIPHQGLHKSFHGLKIVQLSDVHIGPGVSREKIRSIVDQANRLDADIVALTGDIVDHTDISFDGHIEELGLLKAKHGVFYSPGNHEYYWGFHPIIEKIKKLGIKVLINQNNLLEIDGARFAVCGVPDMAARYFGMEGPDFDKALRGAEQADFRMLLSHQPNTADSAKSRNYHLQLSGHTHGGQFIPWSLIIRAFQKYPRGLFQLGSLKLYVNRGTGFWGPPDRLGSYGEISSITLHST